jgi:hypothetical protein
MLVDAASKGDFMALFDIDNAFVQSLIDTDVFVRLPKNWRETEQDTGIRKLVKALYGLPQAPRLWAKCYEKRLIELGWEQSLSRGLWKKRSSRVVKRLLRLGVFVDDNTITGPDKQEVSDETNKILNVFPGKIIPSEDMGNGWVRYDLLGTDVWYNRSLRSLDITMERYIQKLAQKFRMDKCRSVESPCFPESQLYDSESPKQDYPLREIIGCLSWAANICRIDICHPVNVLARVCSKEPTKAIVACCKKVLKYLISHPKTGLHYSPENWDKFRATYQELVKEGESVTAWNTFSDASFASCFISMKSESGSIIYFLGCPILWKGGRQSVRTNSTFEAEYVAASDTLTVGEGIDFRGFFGENPADNIWLDNLSAVIVSTTPSERERPKSRHVALRYMKVGDAADRIRFCPTQHQKADCLTKSSVSETIRQHVFHHNPEMKHPSKKSKADEEMVVDDDLEIQSPCCFVSVMQFLT